jgi:hypothetical protein
VAKVGMSKAGGTISQQAAVHPWLTADAHGNKQQQNEKQTACELSPFRSQYSFSSHLYDTQIFVTLLTVSTQTYWYNASLKLFTGHVTGKTVRIRF